MKDLAAEFQDAEISEIEEASNKDAARMVVAFSLSMLIVLASSIAILYIWKGEDLVIERPTPALSSWEKEYKSLTGVSNQSLSGLDGEGVVLCVVDSGIDLSHPDLSDLVLKGWLDSVNGLDDVNETFYGKMGLLRVYQGALSDAEIMDNYNKTKARFGH